MAQASYTPIGDMDQQIDFYDQPTDPDPTSGDKQGAIPFASGVWAKYEYLWSTSGPKALPQQTLTEEYFRFTIKYMAGLTSQMYIVYHHPDNGDMRFDIAQIGDPDLKRVELKILAIARGNAEV